jgi:putative DNA primase/helicase
MAGSRGAASEDEARLAGARFVQANETGQGMRFNDAAIKDLTGGDTIAARRLYENSFEFRPQFKLWIRGNYKPILNGGDGGIARRVKLIPFAVHIPPEDRDPNLSERLKSELPGILNWAIRGCLRWQRDGLPEPHVVRRATRDYLAEMDPIGSFLDECCERTPGVSDSIENLHRAHRSWCVANGRPVPTKVFLSRQLSDRGLRRFKARLSGTLVRGFRGVRVSSEA